MNLLLSAIIKDDFQDTSDTSWSVVSYAPGDSTVEYINAATFLSETGSVLPADASHCLKITVPSLDSLFRIQKTFTSGLFSSIDTDGAIGVWAYMPQQTIDNMSISPKVKITADSFSTMLNIQTPVSVADGWTFLGGYRRYATTDTISDADLNLVDTFYIETGTGGAMTLPSIFYLTSLEVNGKLPVVVMLEQDDGNEETDYFFDELTARGLIGQLNVISSNVDSGTNTSTTAVINAALTNGHAVCLHAGPELDSLSIEDAATTVQTEIDFHGAKGWTDGLETFAYPGGKFNKEIVSMLEGKGVANSRAVASTVSQSRNKYGVNAEYPQQMYFRSMGGWSGATTAAQMKAMVDDAVEIGTTAIFHFHRIGTGTTPPKADFEEFLDYIVTLKAAGTIINQVRQDWAA